MDVPLEHIRVSYKARDQLIQLKRATGIMQWNILCRWAFCVSLADPNIPTGEPPPADSNIEMSWRTFAGAYHDVYLAVLMERCRADGLKLDREVLARQFRLHLHRGIGHLAGNLEIRDVAETGGWGEKNIGYLIFI